MVYLYFVVFSLSFISSFAKPFNSSVSVSPDLEAEYNLENDLATIYAFSGHQNNDIIENEKVKKYNQLKWYSLGYPRIIVSKNNNKTILFHESQLGFYNYLEMLTKDQKQLLKQEAKLKYNVSVGENQIKNMPFNTLTCEFRIDELNIKETFKGTVKQRNKYPIRIDYDWPTDAIDNKFNKSDVLKILNEQNLDKIIECVIDTDLFEKSYSYSRFSFSLKQNYPSLFVNTRFISERQFNNSIKEIKEEMRQTLNEAKVEINRQIMLREEQTNNSFKAIMNILNKQVGGNYKLKQTFTGHTGDVNTLTILTNGDLASGSDDETIKIWNPNDGTLKRTLTGHTNLVLTLVVLPNGDLASGSYDNTIKIWNPNDGTLKRTLTGHTGYVYALVVLPNGDLASGSEDKTIKIWNLNDGTLKRTLTGHTGYVYALVVLPNGGLASGSSDNTIKIWNPNDGTLKRTLTGHTHYVLTLVVLPNGDLASGSWDSTIKIWNRNDGTLKRTLTGHTHYVYALVVLPNGDLASGSSDNTIKIWNRNDGTLKRTVTGHTNWVRTLVVLPNGDLASGSDDKTIKIWTE